MRMAADFFLWGYVKDQVFIPPLSHDLADPKARIIAAVKNIKAPMLKRVWQDMNIITIYAMSSVAHTSNISIKSFFSFPVVVNTWIIMESTK